MDTIQRIHDQVRQNPKLVVSDDFEFAIIERETTKHRYFNGVSDEVEKRKQTWINLRLVQRKSPGISSVSGNTKESIQYLIESASKAADASKVDPWFKFPLWRAHALQSSSNELVDISPDEENRFLRSQFLDLSRKPYALAEEHEIETEKVTLIRKLEKSYLSRARRTFQTSYKLSLGEEMGWLIEERKSSVPKPEFKKEILAELLGFAVQGASPKIFSGELSSETRFVLGPRVVAFLLNENEGKFLAKLDPKEPQVLEGVAECLTLIDDGTLPGLPQSAVFDMEGSLMERTVLVEKGTPKSLLHCAHSATKENRLSTGNFVLRSDQRFPSLGFTGFFVEKGENSDLLADLGDGLFLERVEGVEKKKEGTTLWLKGYRVKGGELVEALRRVPLTLSLESFLRGAKRVGQDLEFFGNVGSPSILFENIP